MQEKKGVFNLNKKNDWETPPELFKLGCDFFAHEPTLDVCATAENSKCKYHYNEQMDALTKPFDTDFIVTRLTRISKRGSVNVT